MADVDTSQSGANTTQDPQNLIDAAVVTPQSSQPATEWFFADGVKGVGEPPEYFNSKKYKTLAEQARAQRELEKRFGAFTGAPDKYELPDGVQIEESRLTKLAEWAKKHNMNQEAFGEFVQSEYLFEEAEVAEYIKEQKAAIGQDADKRINSVAAWAKANLDEAGFNELKEALSSAASFKVIERLIAMNRQTPLPRAGQDTPAAAGITPEAVRAMHYETDDQGRRKYDYDPDHRKKVKDAYTMLYGDQPHQEIR